MNISVRLFLLLSFVAMHPSYAAAQTLDGVRSAGGEAGGYGDGWDVGVDGAGNVYLTGSITLDTDFDGDGNIDATDDGLAAIFLAKYNDRGGLQWVVAPGGASNEQGHAVAVDAEGNSYITGYVLDNADFDGDGSADVVVTGFGYHLFLAKYDAGGTLQWVRSVCGRGEDVALDATGNVYITGYLESCADFDGDGTADITGVGPFVAKYDDNGEFHWLRLAQGGDLGEGSGLAVDATGHVYYTGDVFGHPDFSGDGVADLVITSSADMFLAKYDSGGTLQWVRSAGSSTHDDFGHGVAVSSTGAVFVTGSFEGAADFNGDGTPDVNDGGSSDAFLASYDAGGLLQWVKAFGSTVVDEGHAVATDEDEVYVTGKFADTIDLEFTGTIDLDGEGTAEVVGNNDIFLLRYDDAGVLQWAGSGGGPSLDDVLGLAVDENGSIYLAGWYTDTIDLNGDGTPDARSPLGRFELFVAKFAAGEATAIELDSPVEVPAEPVLEQNYPNPFNPSTTIRFSVPETSPVTLSVYDLTGRRLSMLVDQVLAPGVYEVVWQAHTDTGPSVASGLFVYRLTVGAYSVSRAMSLLR